MTRARLPILLLLAAACSRPAHLPFYRTADLTPEWMDPASAEARPASFRLLDQRGDTVTGATVTGRIVIANFFLAECGKVCPTMMRALAQVQDSFASDDRVLLLSHSVMPAADSVPVLARYAFEHGIRAPRWRLLTGDPALIARLMRERYLVRRDVTADPSAAEVVHTEQVVLLDPLGRIRGVYDGSLAFDVSQLIADIRALERES